jgi:hypothetical protein
VIVEPEPRRTQKSPEFGMDKETLDGLIRAACTFQSESMKARAVCQEKFQSEESGQENILRILVDGAIARLALRTTNVIKDTNESTSYQIGVSASFVRTHYIISDMILAGDLMEALVLLRKQLESLVRLHEIDKKPLRKLEGKVPNIQNVMNKAAGRLYGHLSEVAHFGRGRVTELLHVVEDGERRGPSLYPVYADRARACFDLSCFVAIHFLVWLVAKLEIWYPDQALDTDRQLIGFVAKVAFDAGVIRTDGDENPEGDGGAGT